MGVDGVQPGSRTGIEAEPALWNEVISDPDTIVIDTRNAYEIAIGSFPVLSTLRQRPSGTSQLM